MKLKIAKIKYYLNEAIKTEKAGKKVEMKKNENYEVPEELEQKFAENPQLKSFLSANTWTTTSIPVPFLTSKTQSNTY